MKIKKIRIEDTYAEAFQGVLCRVIVTAEDGETVKKAAEDATATPSIVISRVEGGIEKWLTKQETPDQREGALLQFWGGINPEKDISNSLKRFEVELSYRIRQDILVKPFTSVFNALSEGKWKIDTMERVGHCGDGYEWTEELYDRRVIVVPIMVPNFIIERYLNVDLGIMGANFWIMCKTKKAVKEAGEKALEAISDVPGVITPFGICSAGSKLETRYPEIGPTTNHPYCPSLKNQLGEDSKVPPDVGYIPEIVINGISLSRVKEAMKSAITSVIGVKDVVKISAGNYGGKLGKYKIYLQELFP
ncbi:MAG: formylmethanofuran--tetrahydromethanopterin N-formyltransferase [Thermoproteota archaeon]